MNVNSNPIESIKYSVLMTISFLSLQISQLRPFRKVAKSAKINLNRYWGLLSQRYSTSPASAKDNSQFLSRRRISQQSAEETMAAYEQEMEQNRINEMLEAQAEATSQNSYNSFVEEEIKSRSRLRFSTASSSSSVISSGPMTPMSITIDEGLRLSSSTTTPSAFCYCQDCYCYNNSSSAAVSPMLPVSRPISPTNPASIFYYYDRESQRIVTSFEDSLIL